jgi:hypothetical protein
MRKNIFILTQFNILSCTCAETSHLGAMKYSILSLAYAEASPLDAMKYHLFAHEQIHLLFAQSSLCAYAETSLGALKYPLLAHEQIISSWRNPLLAHVLKHLLLVQ